MVPSVLVMLMLVTVVEPLPDPQLGPGMVVNPTPTYSQPPGMVTMTVITPSCPLGSRVCGFNRRDCCKVTDQEVLCPPWTIKINGRCIRRK